MIPERQWRAALAIAGALGHDWATWALGYREPAYLAADEAWLARARAIDAEMHAAGRTYVCETDPPRDTPTYTAVAYGPRLQPTTVAIPESWHAARRAWDASLPPDVGCPGYPGRGPSPMGVTGSGRLEWECLDDGAILLRVTRRDMGTVLSAEVYRSCGGAWVLQVDRVRPLFVEARHLDALQEILWALAGAGLLSAAEIERASVRLDVVERRA